MPRGGIASNTNTQYRILEGRFESEILIVGFGFRITNLRSTRTDAVTQCDHIYVGYAYDFNGSVPGLDQNLNGTTEKMCGVYRVGNKPYF